MISSNDLLVPQKSVTHMCTAPDSKFRWRTKHGWWKAHFVSFTSKHCTYMVIWMQELCQKSLFSTMVEASSYLHAGTQWFDTNIHHSCCSWWNIVQQLDIKSKLSFKSYSQTMNIVFYIICLNYVVLSTGLLQTLLMPCENAFAIVQTGNAFHWLTFASISCYCSEIHFSNPFVGAVSCESNKAASKQGHHCWSHNLRDPFMNPRNMWKSFITVITCMYCSTGIPCWILLVYR